MKNSVYTFLDRMKHASMHCRCMVKCIILKRNPMFYIKGLFRTLFTIKY